jgi:hypothetical protein
MKIFIRVLLPVLALAVVAVIAYDYLGKKPSKGEKNPYEYNVDEYREVPAELISHEEIRQIKVDLCDKGALAVHGRNLFLAACNELKIIEDGRKVVNRFSVDPLPASIAVSDDFIVVGYNDYIKLYDHSGNAIATSEVISDSSFYTSVAIKNAKIYVADAGKRVVRIFNKDAKEVSFFEGVSEINNLIGFIIPSPYFEVAVGSNGELWTTNPGMHALQNYNDKGDLLRSWDKVSIRIDGFSGCCNPAQIAVLPNGSFVTSEKGMPRIKIHAANGDFISVVAPPAAFDGEHAPEVAAWGQDTIVALDYDKKLLRIFAKK